MEISSVDTAWKPRFVGTETPANTVASVVPRAAIFAPDYEKANLLLGCFFVVAMVVDSFFHLANPKDAFIETMVMFIFFNVVHTVFSLILASSVPEIRHAVAQSIRARRTWPLLGVFWIVSLTVWTLVGDKHFPYVGELVGLVVFLIAKGHNTFQFMGLSLQYNRQELGATSAKALANERMERIIFQTMIYVFMFQGLVFFLSHYQIQSTIFYAFSVVEFLMACGIIYLSTQRPGWRHSNKTTFLLRIFSMPLFYLSPMAAWAARACHGFEYIGVSQNVLHRTEGKVPRLSWCLAGLYLVCAFAFFYLPDLLGSSQFWWTKVYRNHPLFLVLSTVSLIQDQLHYYLDSCIFRMKDPLIRKSVGPLLAPPEQI